MSSTPKSTQKKISVDIPQEDYELVKLLADQNSTSISDWVRKAIRDSIPGDLKKKVTSAEVLDKAFSILDEQQDLGPIPTLPLPPMAEALYDAALRRPQASDPDPYQATARAESQKYNEDAAAYAKREGTAPHSCIYLSKEGNQHFRPGDCEGICTNPKQNGRICFWPSQVAKNCDMYRGRRNPNHP